MITQTIQLPLPDARRATQNATASSSIISMRLASEKRKLSGRSILRPQSIHEMKQHRDDEDDDHENAREDGRDINEAQSKHQSNRHPFPSIGQSSNRRRTKHHHRYR